MARKRGDRPAGSNKLLVEEKLEDIFELYATGMSMRRVAEQLALPIDGKILMATMLQNDEWRDRIVALRSVRADCQADDALYHAEYAAMLGEAPGIKIAIDQLNKAAARASPDEHSDITKTELLLKADPNLKPSDAYERMVKGK